MHTTKATYLTAQGLDRLQAQLDKLRSVDLPDLMELMTEAQVGGDLQDNREYLLLREELIFLTRRIDHLDQLTRTAQLIVNGQPNGKIHLGNTVVIESSEGDVETYMIVGPAEADPDRGYISYECPLGEALLERETGDEIAVNTPDGIFYYRLISVA
jgi:transcription elongation factor GreA